MLKSHRNANWYYSVLKQWIFPELYHFINTWIFQARLLFMDKLQLCHEYLFCSTINFWFYSHYLGPEQVSPCEVTCSDHFFVSNDHIFYCLNIAQNSPNLEYRSHLPKNLLSFWISTTRCVLPYNSPILYRTFKNLTRSLNCADSHDIGQAHFRLSFFFFQNFVKCESISKYWDTISMYWLSISK